MKTLFLAAVALLAVATPTQAEPPKTVYFLENGVSVPKEVTAAVNNHASEIEALKAEVRDLKGVVRDLAVVVAAQAKVPAPPLTMPPMTIQPAAACESGVCPTCPSLVRTIEYTGATLAAPDLRSTSMYQHLRSGHGYSDSQLAGLSAGQLQDLHNRAHASEGGTFAVVGRVRVVQRIRARMGW